jgi:LysR family transcriptional regulator for bpeEF and oprC
MDRLWAMEVFVRVAEARSFSLAAESLDLANATVSGCIRNFERHLGVTLINRDTRRLSLTEEGLRLLPRAKELVEAATRIEEDIRSAPGRLRGSLRVEMPISIGNAVVCPALPAFIARYPAIGVSLILTNHAHHMIQFGIDVAIRMEHVEDDDLVARPLFEARYVAVCAPGVAATVPDDPRNLDPRRCLGVVNEDYWHVNPWSFERDGATAELEPRGPVNLNSSDAVLQAAKAGLGVALVLDVFAMPLVASGELVPLFLQWRTRRRQFYIATARSGVGSARVRAFSEFLLELFGSPTERAAAPA